MDHLKDKVVVITGAGSGFGRLVAHKSVVRGAQVLAVDVNHNALETLRNELPGVHIAVADVTQLDELKAAVLQAVGLWGRVDVMINNAGVMPLAFYSDHDQAMDAWTRCVDVNFKGVLHGIVAVYDQMISQERGQVINLSSIYGNFPVVGAGVYGATKAAVDFLSSSLRMEAQGKIKVTTVKPTGVPGTNLGAGIVNPDAIVGILGQNAPAYGQLMQAHQAGELPAEYTDSEHIEYYALDPEHLADQIVYVMDQPWGVAISEITVRASGDAYLL
ncbi:MAG: SDR family oxidoreductase [Pseudomonadales bacterium]|jgi:NADP-dependent 3-hydroxy acid dehydrogenase YdfG|nr:SDR family oxidoreductase [Pseudomonadales bacterium]